MNEYNPLVGAAKTGASVTLILCLVAIPVMGVIKLAQVWFF